MPLEAPVTTAIFTPASLRADADDALGFALRPLASVTIARSVCRPFAAPPRVQVAP